MRYLTEEDFESSFSSLTWFEDSSVTCPYCNDGIATWEDAAGGVLVGSPAICVTCGFVYTLADERGVPWLNPTTPQRLTLRTMRKMQDTLGLNLSDEEECAV